jgi:F-type H+-transporting ATPase subunit gamma
MGEGKTVKIMCVGKKGYDVLRRQFSEQIIDLIDLRAVRQLGFEQGDMIAQKVLTLFERGEFDIATLFYSRFRSVIAQVPTAQQVIPAQIEGGRSSSDAVYDYEPDEGEILATLLPRNLTIQIFRAILENAASEQGARMSAMDNATRNAGEMIKKQTMTYNRSRQAMITKELIEIISGAEAL